MSTVNLLDGRRGVTRQFTTLSGSPIGIKDIRSGAMLQMAIRFGDVSDRKVYVTGIPSVDNTARTLSGRPYRLLVKGVPYIDDDRVNFRPAELVFCAGSATDEQQTSPLKILAIQLHFNRQSIVYPTF